MNPTQIQTLLEILVIQQTILEQNFPSTLTTYTGSCIRSLIEEHNEITESDKQNLIRSYGKIKGNELFEALITYFPYRKGI